MERRMLLNASIAQVGGASRVRTRRLMLSGVCVLIHSFPGACEAESRASLLNQTWPSTAMTFHGTLIGDRHDGFSWTRKLNNYGYLPGAPRRDRDALPDIVVNEEKCAKRWGPKQHGKFWYARPGSSESPRMIQRIESLYEVTHQRPMGKQRCIGLAFARGLIAEKLGHAVDWASFAAKQCQRGGRPFISLEELRSKTRRESGWWPTD
ncbi:hypothetical protein KC19_6G036500 [Ceratodon purpureus]|uniref:Uncharacterized protein n=1 Tax=Ceratodon purpureus TaxID=3225 RepID=A0A8T0HA13_CERPU|nr:hypothetical protein KC19_6G036500 [Ceratodon purpureus]